MVLTIDQKSLDFYLRRVAGFGSGMDPANIATPEYYADNYALVIEDWFFGAFAAALEQFIKTLDLKYDTAAAGADGGAFKCMQFGDAGKLCADACNQHSSSGFGITIGKMGYTRQASFPFIRHRILFAVTENGVRYLDPQAPRERITLEELEVASVHRWGV